MNPHLFVMSDAKSSHSVLSIPGDTIPDEVRDALIVGESIDGAARFLGQDPKTFKHLDWAQPFRRDLSYPHRAFTETIQELARELIQNTNRLRSARRTIATKHLAAAVSNLVEAYFAHQDDTDGSPRWVYYSRAKGDPGFNRRNRRDNPLGLSVESLCKASDALCEAGLAEGHQAIKNRRRSRIRATDTLVERLAADGALDLGVILGEPTRKPLMVLKADDGSQGLMLNSTAATERTEAILGPLNAALASASIEIATNDLPTLRKLGRRGVNPRRRQLYRVFHGEDCPSRLEGGFWINMPRNLRHLVRIDGERVAEADFQAMQLHLLYHLDGMSLWDDFDGDDPFSLPSLPDVSRDIVKVVFNAVTNTDTDNQAEPAARNKFRKRMPDSDKGLDLKRVIAALHATHPPITRHRGKTAWKRLQQIESEVMLSVLDRAVSDRVVTLPIHDACLVPESKADWLVEAMKSGLKDNGISSWPNIKRPGMCVRDTSTPSAR